MQPCYENKAGCKYAPRCFSDEHHQFWPRTDYEAAGTIEARWRNLGQNTLQLCRQEHDDIHTFDDPPEMPTRPQMVDDLLASDEHMTRRVRNALKAATRQGVAPAQAAFENPNLV